MHGEFPIKVYLASKYSQKEELRGYAQELESEGITVTSRWITEEPASLTNLDEKILWARYDLADVARADVLVFFAEDPENQPRRGGRHVEFGYALALNKKVLVVGGIENIFHNLPEIQHFASFKEVKEVLLQQ